MVQIPVDTFNQTQTSPSDDEIFGWFESWFSLRRRMSGYGGRRVLFWVHAYSIIQCSQRWSKYKYWLSKSSSTSALAMGRLQILTLDTLLIGMVGASVQCIAKSGSLTANLWDLWDYALCCTLQCNNNSRPAVQDNIIDGQIFYIIWINIPAGCLDY